MRSVLKVPALVVQLVDFDKVVSWYFFTKDLLTKVPPHPESKRTLMRLKSLPFRPPLMMKSGMELRRLEDEYKAMVVQTIDITD